MLDDFELSRPNGEVVKEDRAEHDPPDRQEAETRAITSRREGGIERHSESNHRAKESRE